MISPRETFSASSSSPRETSFFEKCSPLPLRICFRADLYPRVYFPDLTTSASLAVIDSDDLAALDFFVGAMTVVVSVSSMVLHLVKKPCIVPTIKVRAPS